MARVIVRGAEGKEILVGYAGPGETIGEMSAIDGSPRSATVIAQEPLQASYISRDAFRAAIRRTPDAAMRMLTLLVRRLRDVDDRLATQLAAGAPSPEAQPFGDLEQWALAGTGLVDERKDWPGHAAPRPASAAN